MAPLFPLPKVFLYPSVVLPLHIFEPRYRQMIDDLLDRQGWLVISPIQAGYEDQAAGAPPVSPVGGLGEIIKHTRLADGRYLITLAGISRVRLEEIEVDTPYRQVRFEPVSEVQPGPGEAERLQDELREAILQRSDQFLNLPSDLPAGPLSDLLLQNLDWHPKEFTWTWGVVGMEVVGRFLGWRDFKRERDHTVWEIASTTKELKA